MLHIQVGCLPPFRLFNVPESGPDKHQGKLTIREGANNSGAPPDLPIDPFYGIGGPDPPPTLPREVHVG